MLPESAVMMRLWVGMCPTSSFFSEGFDCVFQASTVQKVSVFWLSYRARVVWSGNGLIIAPG